MEDCMKREVVFYSEGAKIVADMYVPEQYAAGEKYPVIILCHGFSGIFRPESTAASVMRISRE